MTAEQIKTKLLEGHSKINIVRELVLAQMSNAQIFKQIDVHPSIVCRVRKESPEEMQAKLVRKRRPIVAVESMVASNLRQEPIMQHYQAEQVLHDNSDCETISQQQHTEQQLKQQNINAAATYTQVVINNAAPHTLPKQEPVKKENQIAQFLVPVLLLLSIPALIGIAYANIYYALIKIITPNNFAAFTSTLALEISPFVIFATANLLKYQFSKNGKEFKQVMIFRAILWVLCLVDVVGISYTLVYLNQGMAIIGISYAIILTILHTGIISLTNEVLLEWQV